MNILKIAMLFDWFGITTIPTIVLLLHFHLVTAFYYNHYHVPIETLFDERQTQASSSNVHHQMVPSSGLSASASAAVAPPPPSTAVIFTTAHNDDDDDDHHVSGDMDRDSWQLAASTMQNLYTNIEQMDPSKAASSSSSSSSPSSSSSSDGPSDVHPMLQRFYLAPPGGILMGRRGINHQHNYGYAQPPLPQHHMLPSLQHYRQVDVCQTGFVEHCLVQANQDGEQRLLTGSAGANNNTVNNVDDEKKSLTREFDGMCHVVVRFIDCLNSHYIKCSPVQSTASSQSNLIANEQNKDLFAESWNQLCAADGVVRKNYLEHATCIKSALSENNGQEECQSRFQAYFMLGHISLDSIENAIQYGCCAFNEWQHCVDSLIVKRCGHDAMRSVQDLIEKASGGLVGSLCDKKTFSRKSKVCMGKKLPGGGGGALKLQSLDPKMNQTLHKYIGIFGDFIDRLPDEEE